MECRFAITSTRSMKCYASQVVDHLKKFPSFSTLSGDIDHVDNLEVDRFADGEMEVTVSTSLRGKDVFLFTSCARNEAGISVEEAKIELYHTVDALKRAQANSILIFEPFISSSRSDRTIRRSSVGLWVHLKTLTSLGTNHILTYQLHSDKSKSMLDPTVAYLEDIPALTLLKRRLCDVYIKNIETLENFVRPNWAFCSVDAGGEKLARRFANAFGSPLVVAHKQRDYSKANTIESINILSAEPLEGKVLWIIDDMIDTAGSVESLILALAKHRPAEVNIAAVHALFSDPALERLTKLSGRGLLNRIVVTDTVLCPDMLPKELPLLEVVPSVELTAQIIGTLVTENPLGKILESFNAERYLKRPRLII
ncbi:MAG: ribose-phosphate diphosphokinase [Spirochaetaceae bacterium]|jgi:ribose-phosphate pyrophosphokinase|nr:ribose-phosphate diphosphokinase [Spirochaetaceae bacterium]